MNLHPVLKSCFLFLLIFCSKPVFSQTSVSGGIYADTTWTLTNSPYVVTGNIVVFPNVKLTIEPGVIVKINSNFSLEIRGNINAEGTITDSIIFTPSSGKLQHSQWKGIKFIKGAAGGSIKYCKIIGADVGLDFPFSGMGTDNLILSHSVFNFNKWAIYSYPKVYWSVDSCVFNNNQNGMQRLYFTNINHCTFNFNDEGFSSASHCYIKQSKFTNNQIGIVRCTSTSILNSFFCNNNIGLQVPDAPFKHNLVQNNNIGISAGSNSNIDSNIIINNKIGVELFGNLGIGNKICNNTINVENQRKDQFSVENNCWCTSNTAEIEAKIIDGYDDVSKGLISYTPIIECDSSDMPILNSCSFTNIPLSFKIKPIGCFDQCNGVLNLGLIGGFSPYTFTWSNGDTIQNVNNLCAGTYYVTVTDLYNESYTDSITINPSVHPQVNLNCIPNDTTILEGSTIELKTSANGGIPPYAFHWSPFIDLSCEICPKNLSKTDSSICYQVVVFDSLYCVDTCEICIDVQSTSSINNHIIEWSLYPNPLNQSSILQFEYQEGSAYTFILFNELGEKIRLINSISEGKVLIKKEGLSNGLYFFQLRSENKLLINGKLSVN